MASTETWGADGSDAGAACGLAALRIAAAVEAIHAATTTEVKKRGLIERAYRAALACVFGVSPGAT